TVVRAPGSGLVVVLFFLFLVLAGLDLEDLLVLVADPLHGLVVGLDRRRRGRLRRHVARGARLGSRLLDVLLVGPAARADRLGLAQVVELRAALGAFVFLAQLRHRGRLLWRPRKVASGPGAVKLVRHAAVEGRWRRDAARLPGTAFAAYHGSDAQAFAAPRPPARARRPSGAGSREGRAARPPVAAGQARRAAQRAARPRALRAAQPAHVDGRLRAGAPDGPPRRAGHRARHLLLRGARSRALGLSHAEPDAGGHRPAGDGHLVPGP